MSTPADLYTLEARTLAERERMGEKSAQNVVDAIDKSRKTTLPRLLFGLGIPQVGESTALALAEQFGNLEKLHAGHRRADRGDAGRRPDRVALGVRVLRRASWRRT